MPAALFGITNDALNLVVNLLILFLVVLWVALIAWTFFDARRRISDPILVASATAASLFPFLGTIVYSILRPPEFLADKRERELEIRASELRVRQLEEASCPNCEHPVERSFLRCPNCRARIKDPCESCGKPIDPRWTICPYCETPQRRAAVSERRPSTSGKRRSKSAPPASAEPSTRAGRSSSTETKSPSRPTSGRTSSRSNSSGSSSQDAPPPEGEPTRESSRQASNSRSSRSGSRSGSSSRSGSPSSSKRGE
jgi:Double zinc ribbon